MLLRLPGVYRPQADSRLLIEAMGEAAIPVGPSVLDVGSGAGALSVSAARAGAREVLAVDVSRRAVAATWMNAVVRGVPVRACHGDVWEVAAGRRFDLILANPPYVPSQQSPPRRGPARAWDAGTDGRAALDKVTALAPALLNERGVILIVHSALCGVDRTLEQLRESGLKAAVVARRIEPFGPVMRGRTDFLQRARLIEAGQRHEELVVIRGDWTERAAYRA
jgi:release factor glutamine methyltransferase